MKKTRTLLLAMMLPAAAAFTLPVHAAYDALRPQEIIAVGAGETLHASDEAFHVDLTQLNVGQTTDNRTAIMKDGQGTFVLNQDAAMHCSLVVREGTMVIGAGEEKVTVTNNPKLESPLITVGGVNAELVLDNASVTQTSGGNSATDKDGNTVKWDGGYVMAVTVGGRDGDGTLTMKNGASLTFAQTVFLGSMSYGGEMGASNPTNAHRCGSYVTGDAADKTLYRDVAIANGGFSNEYEDIRGEYIDKMSTGVINVESGSTLNTGIGLYAGNGTINVSGAGSVLNVGVRAANADNFTLGWIGGDVPAKTTLNVMDGGVVNGGVSSYNKWFDVCDAENALVEINVSGQNSQLNVECGTAYLACYADAKASFNIVDGATSVINAANSYNWQSGGNYYPSGSKVYMADSEGSSLDINVMHGSSMTINAVSTTNTYTTTEKNAEGKNVKVTHTLEAPGQIFIAYDADSHVSMNVADNSSLSIYGEDVVKVGCAADAHVQMSVTDGSKLSLRTDGNVLYVGAEKDSYVRMNVENGSTLTLAASDYGKVSFGGYLMGAAVQLQATGNSTVLLQGYSADFGGDTASDISVRLKDSTLTANNLNLYYGSKIALEGNSQISAQWVYIDKEAEMTVGEGAQVKVDSTWGLDINTGGTLINRGILASRDEGTATATLYNGSRLQTGEALISGCEGLAAEGHNAQVSYATGLESVSLAYASTKKDSTITLGALLTGKDEMQYLSSVDMQKINEAVFSGLALGENAAYTIAYKHEIGKNITVNYTTDHLNHVTGTESVAVNGGAILVEQGEGEHHVGTIGSYVEHAGETAAAVAVGETETGSRVTWQGDGMTTVAGENTKLISGTNVSIGEVAGEGKLTVVADSTLDNNGVINAKTVVEQGGTLKGSGSLGATEVQGTLVVGNSPGAPTFAGDLTLYSGSETVFSIAGLDTPATATLNGWESATYSQITITNGSLTLQDGARFTIEFGGALLSEIGGCQDFSFDLTLVNAGEGAITLGDAALTLLLDNTDFLISPDALAGGEGWSVEFDRSNMAYSVLANGSELHLVGTARLVPEPATATLSLLALAALAARRRRK